MNKENLLSKKAIKNNKAAIMKNSELNRNKKPILLVKTVNSHPSTSQDLLNAIKS